MHPDNQIAIAFNARLKPFTILGCTLPVLAFASLFLLSSLAITRLDFSLLYKLILGVFPLYFGFMAMKLHLAWEEVSLFPLYFHVWLE